MGKLNVNTRMSALGKELDDLMADYRRGKLTVEVSIDSDHDYWWFLEFGTALKEDKTPVAGPQPLGDIIIEPPPRIAGKSKSTKLSVMGTYPIETRSGYTKRYTYTSTRTASGRVQMKPITVHGPRRRFLRFKGTKAFAGKLIRVPYVQHPGIKPKMQLRRCIFAFQKGVIADLKNLIEKTRATAEQHRYVRYTGIPTRSSLHDILLANAQILHKNLYDTTPVNTDSDDRPEQWDPGRGEHLRDVIRVKVSSR